MSHQPAIADVVPRSWLLLLHQLPPEPAYFRVKIWRQLQGLGAVALKNSVYALPARDDTREDFQWLLRAIVEGGGEGTLVEARIVDGFSDPELEALFQAARDADYQEIAEEARKLGKLVGAMKKSSSASAELQNAVRRLRRRLNTVIAVDFFGAAGQQSANGLVAALEARLREAPPERETATPAETESYKGRIWVTRQGVHVDRIACAWLIRRFIDADARFKFVNAKSYKREPGELRFDMFEAEFTHEGERCSFEVMLERFGLVDPALSAIAELVHDIDLKDEKYDRPETSGLAHLILGLCMGERDDETRIARGGQLFDYFYDYFRRKRV
ncbi:MAG TPA: chromate resistance protein ChrB domain-containing protein [Stellaceae bacterium]|nr:chromate resistance protein ChrB domain-containing protein [Stellaceae bacterium]